MPLLQILLQNLVLARFLHFRLVKLVIATPIAVILLVY